MKKNTASQVVASQMVSATDGSAFTGTVTVYVTGDAGTQAIGSVGSGVCTHEGNGLHSYAPSQAETNYNHIAFTFIGTGAIPVTVQVYTESFDRHDTVRLGLTALPNAAADAAGGLPISDAGGLDLDNLPTASADALLTRDWTSVTGEAARSVLNALRFLRNKWSVSGGTLTVTEEDDTTSAWTSTLTTDGAAEPVTSSDPS